MIEKLIKKKNKKKTRWDKNTDLGKPTPLHVTWKGSADNKPVLYHTWIGKILTAT